MAFKISDFDVHLLSHVELLSLEGDTIEYNIKVTKENSNSSQIFDNGLLIAIVDMCSFIKKSYVNSVAVSITLNLTSFEEMYLGKTYRMVVSIKYQGSGTIYYDIDIFNDEDKLVKKGYHLKKIVKSKF
jgi:hypothetical protein